MAKRKDLFVIGVSKEQVREEITLYKSAKVGVATLYKNQNFVDFDVYSAEKIIGLMLLYGIEDPEVVANKLEVLVTQSEDCGYIIMYSDLYKEIENKYSSH